MVHTANFREGNDIASRGRLHGKGSRAVLAERKMRSAVMMVLKIARKDAAQVVLAEDDDVIQTFSADRTDETLCVRVLPARSPRCDDLRDPHRANAMTECQSIGFVSVPQQIARCSVSCLGAFR